MANPYAARTYGQAQVRASNTDQYGYGGDQRKNEAMVLSVVAKNMEAASKVLQNRKELDPREYLRVASEFRAAVEKNWKLWTIFQTELLSDSNEQTPEITKDMLQIASFVDHACPAAMLHNRFDFVDTMVQINRNISAGLLKTPK